MIKTFYTEKARLLAENFWGDKTDKTGHPRMQTLDRIAETIKDPENGQYIVSIIYIMDMAGHSKKERSKLVMGYIMDGLPMRVACAAERLMQRKGEQLDDYCRRIAADAELVLPAALAYAGYMRDPDHYISDINSASTTIDHYAYIYNALKPHSRKPSNPCS